MEIVYLSIPLLTTNNFFFQGFPFAYINIYQLLDEVDQNIVIFQRLADHDILRKPSSVIVLLFDHRVCFLIKV